ncbi:DUF547 domain-containing protein [Gillisia sp. M10.2A]|uniref:DUF547 domain-containing protein n=1 Tax=Gillisia lutea TaxID=2909668 RepID=A0ABS9EEZ4_9FLAO|nr:DUF547 domain-containing protein [Gillisia lutea]MCF4100837.1 DUF547 domain-containing protein [Gillisia lutea]
MKKALFGSMLLVFSLCFYTLNGCTLLSAAGLNDKGLPTAKVGEDLTSSTANSQVNLDHSTWTALLKKHVSKDGLVDYKGFKKDEVKLKEYLEMLSENKPSKTWSVQEQLAYYINIYNAYTVKLIIENYPIKSIKDINGAWTKDIVDIGDVKMSLGGIENSILRKMNDPRIHFAINCASYSCPKLLNEAYTAAKINEQLETATKEFINSDKNIILENSVKLSSIFDWYKKDFKEGGSVIDYINHYSNVKIKASAKITYKEYDWSLNEPK